MACVKNDVFDFVVEFFQNARLLFGCNSSFITFIPKVTSPVVINDFWPISLIIIQYKIISTILDIRLAKLIHLVVSSEQPAFVKSHQILDGPLMVHEVIEWYKKKKEEEDGLRD